MRHTPNRLPWDDEDFAPSPMPHYCSECQLPFWDPEPRPRRVARTVEGLRTMPQPKPSPGPATMEEIAARVGQAASPRSPRSAQVQGWSEADKFTAALCYWLLSAIGYAEVSARLIEWLMLTAVLVFLTFSARLWIVTFFITLAAIVATKHYLQI